MRSHQIFIAIAALLGLTAVIIGSMGAHLFDKTLPIEALERIDTGLKYQIYHTLALLSVGILASLHRNYDSTSLKLSGWAFILGMFVFSGSLYAYSFTGNAEFGKATPFGGIGLMLGWLLLFFFSFRKH